jgi:hypothetical protein
MVFVALATKAMMTQWDFSGGKTQTIELMVEIYREKQMLSRSAISLV